MKKSAFVLLTASTLMADGTVCEPICDPCEVTICDPCCDPCGRWGIKIDAEFLYWYAKENGLELVTKLKTQNLSGAPAGLIARRNFPKETFFLKSNWEPGFRIGLGFDDPCSCWDLGLFWTSLWNNKSQSFSTPDVEANTVLPNGSKAFLSPWIYGPSAVSAVSATLFGPLLLYDVKNRWELNYDFIDLVLSNDLCLSSCCHLRPFVGLKGGWTKTTFKQKSRGESSAILQDELPFTFSERFTNRFSGIGLSAGLEPSVVFCGGFGLYGQLKGALLWGEFSGKRKESVTIDLLSNVFEDTTTYDSSFHGMQSIFEVGLGLRYEQGFCCDRYKALIDLGWEHQLLLHHVKRVQIHGASTFLNLDSGGASISQNFDGVDMVTTDLALGGFVLRAQFEF